MSRLLNLALRSWPADYRDAHGAELIDTAVELSVERSSLREALSLFMNGFQARYRSATNGDPMKTWTAGARIALFASITSILAQLLGAMMLGPAGDPSRADLTNVTIAFLVISAVAFALAVIPPRLMATLATAAAIALWFWAPPMPRLLLAGLILSHGALLWFLAWRGERAGKPMAVRMIGLVVALVILAMAIGNLWISDFALVIWFTIAAVVLAAWDPRLLAGMALFWLAQLLTMVPATIEAGRMHDNRWYLGIACTLVLVAATRVHRVTRTPAT